MDLRDAFMDGLIALGAAEPRIIVLDADVSRTSRSRRFCDTFPHRFHDVGIAEQNMIGIGAGIATTGMVPFTIGFSVFLTLRACEQVRTSVCYANLGVKIVGGYAGLSNAKDGATHQCLEDIAILNSFPNLTLITASDPSTAYSAAKKMFDIAGPVFLRLEYDDLPDLPILAESGENATFRYLRRGSDVTIASCGIAAHRCLRAAAHLAESGIQAEIVDFMQIKPFPKEVLFESVKRTGALVTVEDHSCNGGLSSIAATALMRHQVSSGFACVCFDDVFTESGKSNELLAKYQVDENAIVAAAKSAIARKACAKTEGKSNG